MLWIDWSPQICPNHSVIIFSVCTIYIFKHIKSALTHGILIASNCFVPDKLSFRVIHLLPLAFKALETGGWTGQSFTGQHRDTRPSANTLTPLWSEFCSAIVATKEDVLLIKMQKKWKPEMKICRMFLIKSFFCVTFVFFLKSCFFFQFISYFIFSCFVFIYFFQIKPFFIFYFFKLNCFRFHYFFTFLLLFFFLQIIILKFSVLFNFSF